jgi:hypothetical protein
MIITSIINFDEGCRVGLERTDVTEERVASIFSVEKFATD